MKVIDLLNKIANNEEVPKKIKWEDTIFAYSDYDKDYLEFPFSEEEYKGLFCMKDSILTQYLNDEIEIIEEETTYEQNFTGWQIIQNGKIIASYNYNAPTLKKVDVVDVEKDIKEMLEEKPKKIEEIPFNNGMECFMDVYHELEQYNYKINDLAKAVNYLLEKESDK